MSISSSQVRRNKACSKFYMESSVVDIETGAALFTNVVFLKHARMCQTVRRLFHVSALLNAN